MKCCSAQVAACWEDPGATLAKVAPCIRKAAAGGASLVAFPEQFATGWDPCSHRNIQEVTGQTVSALRELACEHSIAVIGSFREAGSPLPRNTSVAIGSDGGILARYAKIHPFAPAREDTCYAPGNDLGIFECHGLRLGIAICYDLRFPEVFRLYAERGVHGVVVPSAWPESRIRHWELFIRARAAENQMFVAGINTTGSNPVDTYAGCSMTAGPDGSIVTRAGRNETLLFFDLDAATVEEARHAFPVHNDRRNDLYRKLDW
ncbi:MAG TPA: nitrilase-related carbon-nitrogen hydrolase [Methanoregulaceae archaeon]|nr:nitrilase-related carbon-nitrogen hydrolase [Methanoregulaceae archaeon]HPD74673.1 nitrilase-related carbon-nitrogen hydrolase [Methanoregulaceae archaeon]HRY75159.1 nitrilase-related carbon-nitrogen hydrolase [Methanoregulaceae archaeon]